MLNAIPIIGWLLSLLFSISMAIPFWFLWTAQGLGDKYAYFLPMVYRFPSFWDCVGVFVIVSILKSVFFPSFSSSSSSSS